MMLHDVTKHRTACTVYCAASRHARRVTGRFSPLSVLPFTYSTFPAYFPACSVKTQAPSSGCCNYISVRCGVSWHPMLH